MTCLHCGMELPAASVPTDDAGLRHSSGRFACRHCGAEHVRRRVGQLPSGEPLFSVRLWGHLSAARRKSDPAP